MATADELCDRVAFVVDGRIEALDTPAELKIARGQRLVRVEYRGEGGGVETADFRLDGLADDRCVPHAVAHPPCRDHPQQGGQPRRRVRRGHRAAVVMTRFANALRLGVDASARQGFLYAAVFSGLIWLSVLLPMSRSLRPVAEPYILLGDTCIIGFFFIAGTVFFEKQERTLSAVVSTPLRFWEYLAAKLTLLVLISLLVALRRADDHVRIRLPPFAFGGRRGARDTTDAARRVRLRRCRSPRSATGSWRRRSHSR